MIVYTVDIRAHQIINEIYGEQRIGVEVGVFKGDLSWRLLGACSHLFLYMVDTWREAKDSDSYRTTSDHVAWSPQDQHDSNMQKALEAVKPYENQYKIMRMTSAEASTHFADNSLDFVFIDADHSYEGCSNDIKLWHPKVKAGGILSGHDYRKDKDYGVIQAVDEFIADAGRKLRLGGNYTWFITK